jgi:hypothetical protein
MISLLTGPCACDAELTDPNDTPSMLSPLTTQLYGVQFLAFVSV